MNTFEWNFSEEFPGLDSCSERQKMKQCRWVTDWQKSAKLDEWCVSFVDGLTTAASQGTKRD